MYAAQVAMKGLGRVQKVRSRAGRCECRGQLLADHPGLADAGDDHAAARRTDELDRLAKAAVKLLGQRGHRSRFDGDDLAAEAERFRVALFAEDLRAEIGTRSQASWTTTDFGECDRLVVAIERPSARHMRTASGTSAARPVI